MTLNVSARVAGAAFLIYIAAGLAGSAGRWPLPLYVTLAFTECFCALVLAVTLHALTRQVDRDIANFGFVCRVAEGILGAMWISTVVAIRTVAPPADAVAGSAPLDAFLALSRTARSLNVGVGGTFFAAGSLAFCWLLLRGRIIPSVIAWVGVIASVQLVVMLPLQLAGALTPSMLLLWLPMLAFEVPVAVWFLARGATSNSA